MSKNNKNKDTRILRRRKQKIKRRLRRKQPVCVHRTSRLVWKEGRYEIFQEATMDIDGTILPTYGGCKGGWIYRTRGYGDMRS